MDPFTQKLLERTRARRENLQKKMSERPNAANRPMAKRTREPLAEANSVLSEPVVDKAPHPASKPSPSKRRCSEENAPLAADEENQEPVASRAVTPKRSDPQTNKKPPVGPATVRSASSLEKSATRPAMQPQPEQVIAVQPEPQRTTPEPKSSRYVETVPSSPALQRSRDETREEEPKEAPTPTTTGMRSRLQKLAQQRNYWDAEGTSDDALPCNPPSPVRTTRQVDVTPVAAPTASSVAPVGRKGRLANLAATICSWEDDLSHTTVPNANAKDQPGTACGPSSANRGIGCGPSPGYKSTACGPSSGYRGIAGAAAPTGTKAPAADSKPTTISNQAVYAPAKASRVFPPSPQKADVPEVRVAVHVGRGGLSSPVASPQKISTQGRAFPSGPPSAAAPMPQSPLKSQALPRGPDFSASPKKPDLQAKPAASGPSVLQNREKFVTKDTTPLQQRATAGAPVVKSFMDRFGERCQERSNQSSPSAQAKTPTAVTPSTRLAQDRLRVAQAASTTTTADLTQRQKLERESELAQIRNRFQKGTNMWKNMSEATGAKEVLQTKEQVEQPLEQEVVQSQSDEEPTAPSVGSLRATTISTPAGIGSVATPPALTSSPLRRVDLDLTVEKPSEEESPEEESPEEESPEEESPEEESPEEESPEEESPEEESPEEKSREVEMNVDQSITSDVINELFNGVLDQSDDDEEDEEEDPLNISSMSLLTPMAETVASVIKSPERRMMTSTPASSFLEKRKSPDSVPRPSKFQRARVSRAGSTEALDNDLKLLYSIDAYRSTRVKESERPSVKQVMVRNEDVAGRLEEARGHSHTSIKQKMKILTNDMNLQQTIIHQASQALNCCTDQEHGKGSQVEAEAERLLLIATEKRGALKTELERLKGGGPGQRKGEAQDDVGVSASKGSLSLLELRLPLKADFVCSTANKPDSANHYFFIMIRAGAENTVATPLSGTHGLSGDALTFSTKFTMSEVSNDFEVAIEVYYLVQKRELANEKKKKKPSKSMAITPKRFLAITKSSQTPVVASPGGPNAIRTSNFALVGSHRLTLSSIGKNKFVLEKIRTCEGIERELLSDMFQNKVPFLCPLEGHIYLKMQCEVGSNVQERGFLTMFEDVSGFGAWHRRWCVLSGYCISYWTYPDDERRKNPIGRINLANCTSRAVEPVKREFCARPNTFELITVRPQREEDKETLVSQCNNTMCVTKNWLSADTKDERNLWMQKLNQLLVDLRMWQPDSCYAPL